MTDLITATDIGIPATTSLIPATNSDGSAGWDKCSVGNLAKATSLYPLVTPPAFPTWVNQGGATITTEADGSLTLAGALDTSDNIRGVFKSLPATPWAFKIGFSTDLAGVNYQSAGVALRDSASGKLVLFGVYRDALPGGSGPLWFITNYNSPTSKNGNVLVPSREYGNGPFYLSISDDGTTRKASFGYNRYSQKACALSISHSAFLVPDQIGIFVSNFNSTNPLNLSVFAWE